MLFLKSHVKWHLIFPVCSYPGFMNYIMNKTIMNETAILIYKFLGVISFISLGWMPQSTMAGFNGDCLFTLIWNFVTVFHSNCTILHFHHQYKNSHFPWIFGLFTAFWYFYDLLFRDRYSLIFHCVFICIFWAAYICIYFSVNCLFIIFAYFIIRLFIIRFLLLNCKRF